MVNFYRAKITTYLEERPRRTPTAFAKKTGKAAGRPERASAPRERRAGRMHERHERVTDSSVVTEGSKALRIEAKGEPLADSQQQAVHQAFPI